jgi:hypothetical protein
VIRAAEGRVGHRRVAVGAALGCIVAAAGCDDKTDYNAPQPGLMSVEEMRVERLGTGGENVFFLTLQWHNGADTNSTRVDMSDVKVTVGATSASFEIAGLTGSGCSTDPVSPWQPRPGETRETRLRVDLRGDTFRLDVGCKNDASGGFDAFTAVTREAPRSGPALPPGATGTIEIEVRGRVAWLPRQDPQPIFAAIGAAELPP